MARRFVIVRDEPDGSLVFLKAGHVGWSPTPVTAEAETFTRRDDARDRLYRDEQHRAGWRILPVSALGWRSAP